MKKKEYDVIVGIDPDCGSYPDEWGIPTKGGSGVAWFEPKTGEIFLYNNLMPDMYTMLSNLKATHGDRALVVIEASWLVTTNWHGNTRDSRRVAAKKGYDVGRCHEVGKIIVEFCKAIGLNIECQRPLHKMWGGEDRKITHDELARIIHIEKKTSNQEQRDAALLALHAANWPMRLHNERV